MPEKQPTSKDRHPLKVGDMVYHWDKGLEPLEIKQISPCYCYLGNKRFFAGPKSLFVSRSAAAAHRANVLRRRAHKLNCEIAELDKIAGEKTGSLYGK